MCSTGKSGIMAAAGRLEHDLTDTRGNWDLFSGGTWHKKNKLTLKLTQDRSMMVNIKAIWSFLTFLNVSSNAVHSVNIINYKCSYKFTKQM